MIYDARLGDPHQAEWIGEGEDAILTLWIQTSVDKIEFKIKGEDAIYKFLEQIESIRPQRKTMLSILKKQDLERPEIRRPVTLEYKKELSPVLVHICMQGQTYCGKRIPDLPYGEKWLYSPDVTEHITTPYKINHDAVFCEECYRIRRKELAIQTIEQ